MREADPLALVCVGDRDFAGADGEICDDQHINGLVCTRNPGHPGKHIAGDIYNRVVATWPGTDGQTQAAADAPPVYLAADVWSALHLPAGEFEGYYERNGWAETWAVLMAAVRGPARCGRDVDGEPCVLAPHTESTPCYSPGDVSSSEPLPWPAAPADDTAAPAAPRTDWSGAWAELTGYVRAATEPIDPTHLDAFMVELKREALRPVREWWEQLRAGEPG